MADSRTPNLIVIGAMNCGTSALHYYLDLHPEISMSSPKELDFFAGEPQLPSWVQLGGSVEEEIVAASRGNWERGREWYLRHFDAAARVRGEASPAYTYPWHPQAAERLAELCPAARVVFLVRDPLEQVVSQFVMHRGAGVEPRPAEEALADPRGVYGARAHFARCVEPFYLKLGEGRVLVLKQEQLLGDRRRAIEAVFGFAGVEPLWDERMERERHATAAHGRRMRIFGRLKRSRLGPLGAKLPPEARYRVERLLGSGEQADRPELPERLIERWREALGPDVVRLRELTGVALAGWPG